ncbi:unknown [Anaerotruncus sp. CAG:390]|nr:unknown [Anaerotruncus sp. CAG:390]
MAALIAWLRTVAIAAPATPMLSGPTNMRSKTMFTPEENIR